MRSLVTSKNVS